ncbi:cold-shock protein [Mesorhizobium sp. LSHC440B00]|nr:cold-shock protein [Mesorhizobium sp. LSHC440B00]ESX31226.1 hypothetical protein X764_30520 [Mesorhizobium sp. LSHC440A00]
MVLLGGGADQNGLAFLARRASEKNVNGRWLWMLTPAARRDGLQGLPASRGALRQFLDANNPDPDDLFGRMLQVALAQSRRPTRSRSAGAGSIEARLAEAEEQVALLQAVQLVIETGIARPSWVNEATMSQLRRAITLTSREEAGKALLPEAFRGRVRERRLLMGYAIKGMSAIEAARAKPFDSLWLVDTVEPLRSFSAIALGGVGGAGKSALLGVVRKALATRRDLTLIVFDFDQPQLRFGDIAALSLDFSRQLGLIEPGIDEELAESRDIFRSRIANAGPSGQVEKSSTELIEFFATVGKLLANKPRLAHPLVFVLDTFEELLAAGAGRFDLLSDWLGQLRQQVPFPEIRIILSGRAIDSVKASPYGQVSIVARTDLGDLGRRAGEAKLRDVFRRHGLRYMDLVPRAVGAFGSNPLVLEILARYCAGKRRRQVIKLIESGEKEASTGLQAEFGQRFLYSRILDRIADKQVKALASPGLILRRVTVALIRDVLAGPCSLGDNLSEVEARAILDKLVRQIWLVDAVGADEAVHRRDLRRLMLPQILRQPGSKEIAAAAGGWYATHTTDEAGRFESLYYRALAGEPIDDVGSLLLRGLSLHLGADVQDLPLAVRARVKNAAGNQRLSEAEVDALPAAEREKFRRRRRRALVSEGLESAVLEGLPIQAGTGATPATSSTSKGTVKFFNAAKGFGFITPDEGAEDIFVHISAVERAGLSSLVEGQKVSYEMESDRRSGKSAAIHLHAAGDGPTRETVQSELDQQQIELASPEIIEARFNTGDFAHVASMAGVAFDAAANALMQSGRREELKLNHPAYLTAVAALLNEDVSPSALFGTFANTLLAGPTTSNPIMTRLRSAALRELQAAVDAEGPLVPVILAVRTAGFDPWPLLGAKSPEDLPFPRPANTPVAFRVEMALRHLRRSPIEVKASMLPILHPPLAARLVTSAGERLDETSLRLGLSSDHGPLLEALGELAESASSGRRLDIAALNRIDDLALQASVVIPLVSNQMDEWPLVAAGRVPELYAAARNALLSISDTDTMTSLFKLMWEEISFWPEEVSPGNYLLTSKQSAPRVVASLVDIADRCGRFGKLLEAAARLAPQSKAGGVLRLYETLCSVWAKHPRPLIEALQVSP